jgi:lysophospholipase L1-like esterase
MITDRLRSPRAAFSPVRTIAGLALLFSTMAQGQQVTLEPLPPPGLRRLPIAVTGRVERGPDGSLLRQWPGTYFETAFTGRSAYFRVGLGEVSLRVTVDDGAPLALVKPAPETYRVSGLAPGRHHLRIDIASESQAGPTRFDGFFAPASARSAALSHRSRSIEFIGDSHTVGYGNTSPTRQCSEAEVWGTTDTSRGLASLVARHYGADYQVNAISGRGVVRNYNGFAARTLPQAYRYATLDGKALANPRGWVPQIIVISLGTNDFSTPLNGREKWTSREGLHADFEATYVGFVGQLRTRYPQAQILLWATDLANGEIRQEVARVVGQLRQLRVERVKFVPVENLSFSACNSHPSLADDATIARRLIEAIDADPGPWAQRRRAH